MFRRLSEPLPLSEASLLALRPALNAPVLNVGFLPVGPARAAIVAFGEEWGGVGIAFGIRSNESGQVAVFRNQESIEPDVPVATALEPILAEAERMGFLFDEDMVASVGDGTGRVQAMALWGRLMGELELPPAPRAAPAEPAARESVRLLDDEPRPSPLPPARPTTPSSPPPNATAPEPPPIETAAAPPPEPPPVESSPAPEPPPVETAAAPPPEASLGELVPPTAPSAESEAPDELLLDDRLPELDLGVEGVVVASASAGSASSAPGSKAPRSRVAPESLPTAKAEAPPPEVPPQQKLSKFRHVDAAVEKEDDNAGGGSELGRIPLVRVRRERDGAKKPSTLARLLASF